MASRAAALCVAALLAFAANSLLCRAALGPGLVVIDAASFTTVRIASGAAALLVVALLRRSRPAHGSWASAAALFAYAIAFSLAYRLIPAGAGAFLLFGSVQVTMIGTDLVRGGRPRPAEWAGLLLSLGGLAYLAAPGAQSLSARGALLMAAAGVAWGIYSLRGRGTTDPASVTTDNFLRAVPLALAASLVSGGVTGLAASGARGLALAAISGAVTSGLGYVLWYAALRSLSATRAAVVQLSVPVLAAAGGVLLLGEAPSPRLLSAAPIILGGVALAALRRAGR